MKKLFLFAMAAVALASCSESDELALSQAQQEAGRGEVAFSVYANRTTRAGKEGVMDMTNLQNANAGFGIFGYHTNNSLYDPQNSEPNFMYNQRVTWNTEENKWTYDPVKYWPNEFGENAVSNDIDYVSFFAYAPYVEFDPISGVALMPEMPETDEPLTPEQESQLKNQIQWKNITGASRNGDKGDPFIRYMVDVNPSTSVDLMWGVAADNSFQGLANPAVTSKVGECFINLSKQIGVNQTINWRFHHALAKLDVQIIAASDVATEGTTEYTPGADAIPVDEFTRVYLRWIEFSGFAMSGALSLNSKAPQAHWLNYDGATELKSTTIRFNDGLLNGKEGILDNVNPNEVVLGALNPELIEEPTPLVNPDDDQKPAWLAKNKGIPTDKYANVFAGATEDKTSFFVIPTNAPLTINMLYDIETMDTQLNKYLSDGVTPGTRISNEITKELRDVKIEAGKAYTIKIVVGLESVKVTAEVVDWNDEAKAVDVDMPHNPSTLGQAASMANAYVYPAETPYTYKGEFTVNENTNTVNYAISATLANAEGGKYIMNDMAYFLGALYRSGSGVTEITYKDVKYTWDETRGNNGSNWANAGSTLIWKLKTEYLGKTLPDSFIFGTNKGDLKFTMKVNP